MQITVRLASATPTRIAYLGLAIHSKSKADLSIVNYNAKPINAVVNPEKISTAVRIVILTEIQVSLREGNMYFTPLENIFRAISIKK